MAITHAEPFFSVWPEREEKGMASEPQRRRGLLHLSFRTWFQWSPRIIIGIWILNADKAILTVHGRPSSCMLILAKRRREKDSLSTLAKGEEYWNAVIPTFLHFMKRRQLDLLVVSIRTRKPRAKFYVFKLFVAWTLLPISLHFRPAVAVLAF